jgi:hypothetical protein
MPPPERPNDARGLSPRQKCNEKQKAYEPLKTGSVPGAKRSTGRHLDTAALSALIAARSFFKNLKNSWWTCLGKWQVSVLSLWPRPNHPSLWRRSDCGMRKVVAGDGSRCRKLQENATRFSSRAAGHGPVLPRLSWLSLAVLPRLAIQESLWYRFWHGGPP